MAKSSPLTCFISQRKTSTPTSPSALSPASHLPITEPWTGNRTRQKTTEIRNMGINSIKFHGRHSAGHGSQMAQWQIFADQIKSTAFPSQAVCKSGSFDTLGWLVTLNHTNTARQIFSKKTTNYWTKARRFSQKKHQGWWNSQSLGTDYQKQMAKNLQHISTPWRQACSSWNEKSLFWQHFRPHLSLQVQKRKKLR